MVVELVGQKVEAVCRAGGGVGSVRVRAGVDHRVQLEDAVHLPLEEAEGEQRRTALGLVHLLGPRRASECSSAGKEGTVGVRGSRERGGGRGGARRCVAAWFACSKTTGEPRASPSHLATWFGSGLGLGLGLGLASPDWGRVAVRLEPLRHLRKGMRLAGEREHLVGEARATVRGDVGERLADVAHRDR